jgi:DNA polymerase III sliding clamp (beta) subunit (PCNA family)
MRIGLYSNDVHEVLKLSKANNISFINENGITYISATERQDTKFKSRVIKKVHDYGEPGQTLINKDVLKLIPKYCDATITEGTITAGRRKIKYSTNDLVDKPIKVDNYLTTIPAGGLSHLLSCDYAMSETSKRPVLNGICIQNDEFTACDSCRVAVREGNFEAKEQAIISADIVPILKKVKYTGEVEIYCNDYYVKFVFGDLEVIGNRRQGEYFNYKSVIPDKHTASVVLETKPLLDILKDYKKNKFKLVKLDFKENELILSANNQTAAVEDCLCISMKGKPLEIAFNLNYLIDALNNYETATLELNSNISPMVIKSDNKLDLVLPVRLTKK